MVKVCHMTSAHRSGDVRIFYKECASLAASGYDTYLVAQGDSREENGVHVVGLGKAPESRLKRMTDFAKKVYDTALEVDADIYHIHDPELLPYAAKLKKRGKKVIFDSHENTLEQMTDKAYIPRLIRPLIAGAYRNYAGTVFRGCDALISVTPHIVEQLEKLNPNTWMITNYPRLSPAAKCDKTRLFSLCFAGGIEAQWNHEKLINCIGRESDVEYDLCGRCNPEYLKKLESLEGWSKVNYYGSLSHSEALKIQNSANAGVALLSPSRNTGFSVGTIGNTKLFEYMLSGIPIICTDFILWRDIVEKNQCGICVDLNNEEELDSAIDYLRNYPDRAAEMGQNGRRAVEEEFNWGTQEKKLLELYNNL